MVIEAATIIAVVIGLTEVIKRAGAPIKYVPVISIILGTALAFLVGGQEIRELIFSGIVYGLSASGLYSGAKTMVKTSDTPTDPQNPE